ncbi:MAG: NAD(+) synthase [Tidjanibacter sp.]|nr:NAD(+) synthase [Tidjanibacter sp.]
MNAEYVERYIVSWLSGYAAGCGSKGFVVGISGGVDSAVVSALCARTGLPTLCVTLPIHQAPSQVSRADEHIRDLMARYPNVECATAELTEPYESLLAALPREGANFELTTANTRARLRMTTLYFYAGLRGALVAGTGNKIEDFGIGFYTKWGDGGVDISPIGDLTKTEVFELGAHLGVCDSILSAKPTDGLFGDDRSDEDQIGATYPELEWAMEQTNKGLRPEKFEGREREVMEIYVRRNRANRHKMEPIPVCIIK